MHTILGLRAGLLALVVAWALQAGTAQAQLVDNPQNLLKAWAEAYATRGGEAMTCSAADARLGAGEKMP